MTKEKLPTTWWTRDQGEIPIADMDDRHLDNTIAMLQRNAQKIASNEAMHAFFEVADDEMSDGVFNALHSGAADLYAIAHDPVRAAAWMKQRPQYRALVKERKRRRKLSKLAGKQERTLKWRMLATDMYAMLSSQHGFTSYDADAWCGRYRRLLDQTTFGYQAHGPDETHEREP
jgi:hypothetical protein